MLAALSVGDKAGFLGRCTEAFTLVAEPQFNSLAERISPNLRGGFELEHLGNLQRRHGDAAIFKIKFVNQADEAMAMISEQEDKVAGLLLK